MKNNEFEKLAITSVVEYFNNHVATVPLEP